VTDDEKRQSASLLAPVAEPRRADESLFLHLFGPTTGAEAAKADTEAPKPPGYPLRIDSFPVLGEVEDLPGSRSRNKVKPPARAARERILREREEQVLKAFEVLVAETRATKRTQVLCVAVGGNNPAADEIHVRAVYHPPPAEKDVTLSMEMFEVKYGFKTSQKQSKKIEYAVGGIRVINTLLATRNQSDPAFPSCIETATQTFLNLGLPGLTSDTETLAFKKVRTLAEEVNLKAEVHADPRAFLSPTLNAFLIDEDVLLPSSRT
jgi:hypothetical protein